MRRPFSSSYLAGEAAARAFIRADFRDAGERKAAARRAAARTAAPGLLAALRDQEARLPESAARRRHLERLAAGGTAVVATGQQVGLFLGPLYSFYKAASAVAVARAIEGETGVPCVPLFWLQTEDHDFAEIAGCTVAGAGGAPARLRLRDGGEGGGDGEGEGGSADARCSVAHRVLGSEVNQLIGALGDALPSGPAAAETLALLRAHYVAGRPLAAAFAGLLGTLFADEGLLILDPREARVATEAATIYRRGLETAAAVEQGLTARRAQLDVAGFAEQITLRPDCSLLFFHPRGATGPRFRLQWQPAPVAAPEADGCWILAGDPTKTELRPAELLETLQREPLRFSTSALLRPIVQDTLLPTVAYVGGPGEINYFAQMAPLYDHFGLTPPLVVPRGRFRVIDSGARRLLRQLGLAPDDVGRPRAALADRLPLQRPPGAADPAALRQRVAEQITPLVEELIAATLTAGPAQTRAADRTRASVAHALRRLVDRYEHALVERDTVTTARLERLRAALCPEGVPQERFYSWPSLAGRYGWRTLKTLVLERLQSAGPFSTALQDIEP
ncbi:MAG TPA: bacillithiol biosynthesis cysteine-adding enzyme BshC [Polyangia bacterium]|nr:bacillithiol biosynthesis cysteine-adding enzyme BshC [Polyangia bacterium]